LERGILPFLIFIGKGHFFFFTRVGSFLYWVDLAHLRQLTAPPKPPEAKHAADCFLDLKGIGLAVRHRPFRLRAGFDVRH